MLLSWVIFAQGGDVHLGYPRLSDQILIRASKGLSYRHESSTEQVKLSELSICFPMFASRLHRFSDYLSYLSVALKISRSTSGRVPFITLLNCEDCIIGATETADQMRQGRDT